MKHNRAFVTDFTFHNVGQGLFYSGRIGDFNFIYDCGSEKKRHLESVVSDFKRHKLGGSSIDLLILSHLHDDHVSGLDALLDNQTSVDTVMLPYLSPIERLMVSLGGSNPPAWLREFWADPVSFLIDRRVRRIVLFGGNEASPPDDVSIDEEYVEDTERKMGIDKMSNDEKLENEVRKRERKLVTDLFVQKRLLAKKHDMSLKVKNSWLFRFFNRKLEDPKQYPFEQCVKAIIQDDDLIDAIRNRSKLRKLKTCYDKLGGDFNDTSLILYHAPISGRLFQIRRWNSCPRIFFSRTVQSPNKLIIHLHSTIGHFLTGDINLNRNWAEIERHFSHYLSGVSLALVPHHGSGENWNQVALNKIANTCCWVTSAGIHNKYGHPNPAVCQDIINNGNSLQCVNEGSEISIRSIVHV